MESTSISSKLEKKQIKKSVAYLQKLSHIQSNQLLQRTNRSLKVFIYLLQKPIYYLAQAK